MVSIEPHGLKEAAGLLKMLSKIGSLQPVVEFVGGQRTDGNETNAQILHYHRKGVKSKNGLVKRDAIGPSDEVKKKLDQEMLKWLEKGINREIKNGFLKPTRSGGIKGTGKVSSRTLLSGKISQVTVDKKARDIVSRAFKKTAYMWKLNIGELIRSQQNADGSSFDDLSEAYKPVKQRLYNRTYPILVATGQVLNSISNDMGGIRFKFGK